MNKKKKDANVDISYIPCGGLVPAASIQLLQNIGMVQHNYFHICIATHNCLHCAILCITHVLYMVHKTSICRGMLVMQFRDNIHCNRCFVNDIHVVYPFQSNYYFVILQDRWVLLFSFIDEKSHSLTKNLKSAFLKDPIFSALN